MNMFFDYMRLWQSSWMQMLGQTAEPVAAPAKGDNRFRDDDWQNNFVFDYIKQSYLIAARHIHDGVSQHRGTAGRLARRRSTSSPASTSTRCRRRISPDQSAGAARDGRHRRHRTCSRA